MCDGKLQQRISQISREAKRYAEDLNKANWHGHCDKVKGTLGTDQTWALLGELLVPTKKRFLVGSRAETSKEVARLLHEEPQDDTVLLRNLEPRYIATGPRSQNAHHTHVEECSPPDAIITEAEVRAALPSLTSCTTPGKDGIS